MSSREENVKIYLATLAEFQRGKYSGVKPVPSIRYVDIDVKMKPLHEQTLVEVTNLDTFTNCGKLIKEGYNVVGLNFASPSRPGGGVEDGSFAQEEDLFRRSNYTSVMSKKHYRLPEDASIYSPQVMVIKDANYQLLAEPFNVAMIASAALRHPKLTNQGRYFYQADRETMKMKVEQIFKVAYFKGHDTLVLGAYGLGAFKNSTSDVIEIFNEVIKQYWGCFRMISFGVIDFKTDNYDLFNKYIKTTI
jgi:uncharacterized protein (TIGR02452 family)